MSNRWERATLLCLVGLVGCDKIIEHDRPGLNDRILETHKIGSIGDTSLQLMAEAGNIAPAPLYWQLQSGPVKVRLHSLSELEGRITLNRAEDALYILRLVSDNPHATGSEFEVEVKPDDQCSDFNRGLPNHIPSAIYLHSGLKPAILQTTPSGFVITRLMYVPDDKKEIGQLIEVRETMGRDGKYTRKILSSKTPPPIPGIKWIIYYRL